MKHIVSPVCLHSQSQCCKLSPENLGRFHTQYRSMSSLFYSSTTYGVLGAVLVLVYALYRAALPKPIPGIPHHVASANSVLGDAPAMVKHKQKYATTFDWMTAQTEKLNSPIVQLFLKPFSRPIVVVTDHREIQDVVLRRAKDFDRSTFFKGTCQLRHDALVSQNRLTYLLDAFGGVCKWLPEVSPRPSPHSY